MTETLLNFDKTAINALSDGIVLLDAKGRVTGITRMPSVCLKRIIENRDRIADWVTDAAKGTLPLPAIVKLCDGGRAAESAAEIQAATLCRNGRLGYALIVRQEAQTGCTPIGADIIPLMGKDMQVELLAAAERLGRFAATGDDPAMARRQASHLQDLLRQIAALAELRGRDMIFSEERFQLAGVVSGLLRRMPFQTGTEAIRYSFDEGNGDQGYIYGSRGWMEQALHTLLLRLARACPPEGQVRIELRQFGDYIVVKGISGATGEQGFAPAPPDSAGGGAVKEGRLDTEICRRIIELHGGQIKLVTPPGGGEKSAAEGGGIESMTLTLPTGLPVTDRSRVSCAECRITLQAKQYAHDLAEMMAQGADSTVLPLSRKAS